VSGNTELLIAGLKDIAEDKRNALLGFERELLGMAIEDLSASQPREVEVSEAMVERGYEFTRYQDEATGLWTQPVDDMRGLLVAALGGGDHVE